MWEVTLKNKFVKYCILNGNLQNCETKNPTLHLPNDQWPILEDVGNSDPDSTFPFDMKNKKLYTFASRKIFVRAFFAWAKNFVLITPPPINS